MRRVHGILMTALLGVAFGPALADPTGGADIGMLGTSDDTCQFTATKIGAFNAPFISPLGAIFVIADPNTAFLVADTETVTHVGMCNYAHNLSLQSTNGGMVNNTPPSVLAGDFITTVPYTVDATWAGTNLQLDTETDSNTAVSQAVAGANSGDLVIVISIAPDPRPLVAGTFADTLTIQIGNSL